MNKVILIGRLARDPDLRYLPSGNNTAVARFTLAVDRGMSKEKRAEAEANDKPTADFISVTAWGKLAENCSRFLRKGMQTAVSGRIQTGSYEKDGRRIYTTEVNANEVQFIEWPEDEDKDTYRPGGEEQSEIEGMEGFYTVNNEDIPF